MIEGYFGLVGYVLDHKTRIPENGDLYRVDDHGRIVAADDDLKSIYGRSSARMTIRSNAGRNVVRISRLPFSGSFTINIKEVRETVLPYLDRTRALSIHAFECDDAAAMALRLII